MFKSNHSKISLQCKETTKIGLAHSSHSSVEYFFNHLTLYYIIICVYLKQFTSNQQNIAVVRQLKRDNNDDNVIHTQKYGNVNKTGVNVALLYNKILNTQSEYKIFVICHSYLFQQHFILLYMPYRLLYYNLDKFHFCDKKLL